MSALVHVAVADEQVPIREGLRAALVRDPRFAFAGAARDAFELLDLCQRTRPQRVVVGASMPGQIVFDTVRALRRAFPTLRQVVYASDGDAVVERLCLDAGADAFCSKRRPVAELLEALARDAEPRLHTSDLSAPAMGAPGARSDLLRRLSRREHEIFQEVVRGRTFQEIALRMELSAKTVHTHWSRVCEKLGIGSVWEALAYWSRVRSEAPRSRVLGRDPGT